MMGTYKVLVSESSSSSQSYMVIEFYSKEDKSKPALYGKYYRGTTDRNGAVIKKAYIQILGVKLEACKKT